MTTLIVDSSAGYATAILAKDEHVVAAYSVRGSALSLLHHTIQTVNLDASRSFAQVDQIAVVQGPGSWTGLHNCVVTAKTMAQVLDVPLIPLSMLEVFATEFDFYRGTVCAMLDAKRDAVYSAAFQYQDRSLVKQPIDDRRRGVDELADELSETTEPLLFVGSAADMYIDRMSARLSRPIDLSTATYPSHGAFARLASKKQETALTGEAQFALAPDYMQADFVRERVPNARPRN